MKHTPGPWTVEETAGGIAIVSELGEVAQALGADNPDDETMPNAYLLAAAPDLYGACKAAFSEVEDVADFSEHDFGPLLSLLTAAIVKAEGAQ